MDRAAVRDGLGLVLVLDHEMLASAGESVITVDGWAA